MPGCRKAWLASTCVLVLGLAGCGRQAPALQGQASSPPQPAITEPPEGSDEGDEGDEDDDVVVTRDLGSVLAEDEPGLTPPDRVHHERARTVAREGDLVEAKRLLGRLAVAYPQSALLVEQYNTVCAHIETMRAGAKQSLEAMTLRELEAPPGAYKLVRAAQPSEHEKTPKLVKSSDKRNEIVDDERWFVEHALHGPRWFVPPPNDVLFAPGTISTTTVVNLLSGFVFTEYEPHPMYRQDSLPLALPLSYGTMPLTDAIESSPYIVAIYGKRIVAVFDASARAVGLFDFAAFMVPPGSRPVEVVVGEATLETPEGKLTRDITMRGHDIIHEIMFALARDGVLYVQHGNLHYAKTNRGQNAYVSAIELATGDFLWRSDPLVANGRSFALAGAGVVCGYGFTAERDFLYVLDRATGRKRQTIPLRKGPTHIARKDDSIFVRTYDRDLVFTVR